MDALLINILLRGGIFAAAAVGLVLHIRLVRYFDLGWAIWAMLTAMLGVYVARLSAIPILGVMAGGCAGAILGAVTDGVILRSSLTSFVPKEVMERFNFIGALALFLIFSNGAEVLGFRDHEMIPAAAQFWYGLSSANIAALIMCYGSLLCCGMLKLSAVNVPIKAMLDNSSASPLWGLSVPAISGLIGGLAGFLTGVGASSFGVLYGAHYSTGLEIMLIAVIPCILVAFQSSVATLLMAIVVAGVIETVRFLGGYTLAEFIIYGSIIVAFLRRPEGMLAIRLREV